GHNLHWGAPGEVAADLAAYLRDGGAPTRDLHHADPGDPSRVLTVPGEARLVEMHASDCPA
ncbi:MAG TPA: hypothetical protein VFP98_04665, partial [Candidatus Polarisedimenticolia bacterium]|nr:hypothetical protein [Candidatus Polarisedimenticolia bacterium]